MKLIYLFSFVSLIVFGCKGVSQNIAASDRQMIEYKIDDNEYAIVVVQSEGVDQESAKQLAMQKAAQKTQGQKLRYFTIESEGNVQAMNATGTAYDNPAPPRNLYYELIQSGNFGRDKVEDQRIPQEGVYQAYRIIFKCYAQKPSEKAIDSCSIIPCSGS